MVYVVDEGSEFDVPIDKIWRYNQSETEHNHPSMRNTQLSMEGQSMVLTYDSVGRDGTTTKSKTKITPLPPVGFWVEMLEGGFAGTKFLNYYVPKGDRTAVTVVGDWASTSISQDKLKKAALDYLQMVFEEDSANLEKFS